jgi:hypothetical protein
VQCAGWLLYQRNLKLSALATQYAAFVQRDGELAKQACKRSFEGYGVGLPYHKLSQIRNWVGDNSAMPLLEMKKAVSGCPPHTPMVVHAIWLHLSTSMHPLSPQSAN